MILTFFFTNVDLNNRELVMNQERKQIYQFCALNELFINFATTNYMLISSLRYHPTIKIDSTEPKKYIKYLRVYIDKHVTWQPQIQHINNKIANNARILTKLRYYIEGVSF